MAINLSNVNIQISQFQEVASGEINAGEVKLVREILDRNAATINGTRGAGTIRTSDEIYAAMSDISKVAENFEKVHFAADRARGKEIGPDDTQGLYDIFVRVAVLSRPGLDRRIGDFLRGELERGANYGDPRKQEFGAIIFLPFRAQNA